ncbi:ABC-F family ATP-binding cassette domain-containing protein [Nesterenkonia halophila]|uniref:ABC-F family ATP-binding cassette domain-containing protein n=1 Tax=Nesterenkonia halophila TaxID=302044 RepID=UPI0012921ECD|nr:ABC-F family ATP-binding cassette domain-containing protein [Nesterenkonia halophila]
MAHLLGAEGLTLTFGTRTILDGLTIGIDAGDRIGIVGRNGDGKSTLMRLLAGRAQADDGRVTWRGGVDVGFLDQSDVLDGDDSIRRAVVGEMADYEWASSPMLRDVADGLLGGLDWDQPVGALSGGQRRRVALAKLLMGEHDVLMLDEPTNHLDVEGVAWLADHLKKRWKADEGAFLVVTHDRWFLDEICTTTWEVHDATVDTYEGGYAAYTLARAERDRAAAVEEQKRQQLVKKELAWLRRGAPARTSKPKFRVDAATALINDVPEPRDTVSLRRMATARLGKDVLDLEHVTLRLRGEGDEPAVADGRTLFDDVTFRLGPGERVGVVGVNGAGKSTLLRLLDGQVTPDEGRIKRGRTVQTAILSQEVEELREKAHMRVHEVMTEEKNVFVVGGKELSGAQLLEQIGFNRKRQWTPVSDLSGGERRRLQLLKLMTGEPNVLMLDEPTNDLDTDTLASMEDLLDDWPGTLVVVSHDRYLLERVTDHQVALLGDGSVRLLPGGVEQYLRIRSGREAAPGEAIRTYRGQTSAEAGATASGRGSAAAPAGSGESTSSASSSDSGPAGAAETPDGASAAEKRQARKQMQRVEKQMEKLSSRQRQLHEEMATASEAGDVDRLRTLQAELDDVDAQLGELEETWLEAGELAE